MDSLIVAAGRALMAGDPLGALDRIALRDDPPALALRGIAMAQLGDYARSRALLRRAARAFGPRESVARARCVVAEAEVALASRDLTWAPRALDAARRTLEAHGDARNAAHAGQVEIRRLLLMGHLEKAEQRAAALDAAALSIAARAIHELVLAGIAIRRLRIPAAREAFARAARMAGEARIPALRAEIESASRVLDVPAARLRTSGSERVLRLDEIEGLFASPTLVVDACRHAVRLGGKTVPLARRPVLFELIRVLAESWPAGQPREALVARVFGARRADESHRARLRVEVGRLRKLMRGLASVNATPDGFQLLPREKVMVAVLAPPVDGGDAAVLALLEDGQAWSSSALALALGTSQRTVQRSLDALSGAGRVQSFGRARARRWTAPPVAGFTTAMLLPTSLTIA